MFIRDHIRELRRVPALDGSTWTVGDCPVTESSFCRLLNWAVVGRLGLPPSNSDSKWSLNPITRS
jgi:hypothetical protein